jgi:hypothetical protein
MIERSAYYAFMANNNLKTCSEEDLVIMKSFADRAKDWGDIETILIRQTDQLNWDTIHSYLYPLCELKEDSAIPQHLEGLRKKFNI